MPFFHLSQMEGIERAFFGSRHGKSACDACGGVVKRALDHDVLSGCIIQNASQACNHLNRNHSMPSPDEQDEGCCHKRRSFRLIKEEEVDRSMPSSALSTVQGTRDFHNVRGLGEGIIAARNLACYCRGCVRGGNCESANFILPWKVIKMKRTTTREETPSPELSLPASPEEQDFNSEDTL